MNNNNFNNMQFDPMTGQRINQQPPVQNTTNMYSQQPQQSFNTYQQPVQPQQPKKKINPKLLIVIITAIIVVVSIIFVPKLFGNKEKNNMSESLTDSTSFWISNNENLYALFDINGKQVTKFNYKYVGDNFVNGSTHVKNVDGQYGIISEKGKMITDFGKYSNIYQIAGLYEVRDESYNKYLIDGKGNILYELESFEVKSYDSDSFFILENEDTDTYHVLNYEGKEITSFSIDSDADSPITSERDDYVSIFYNNKEYIINPFSKKVINTFDSDKAFTIKGISENGTILLNSYSDWSTRDEPTTYKIVKDNKVNDLPEECTSIYFDENDNNIICENDDGSFLLNDSYQKGIKISTNLYVNKVYSDNKGYAYERINSNNLVLRVDFVQNEKTVKSVSCRELADSGYMANGLYVLETKNYLDNCKGESGGSYEYYNTSGEKMFGRAFGSANAFDKNNLAIVNEVNTKEYSLIDTQGKQVGNSYESVKLHDYYNYYIVTKDKMYGLLNENGKEIVPCKYSRIEITNNNYAKMKTSDSKNIIFDLSKGKEILSLDDTESNVSLSKNYITTSFGGKTRYYSYTTGKLFYEK